MGRGEDVLISRWYFLRAIITNALEVETLNTFHK